jgi:hypothetical protein
MNEVFSFKAIDTLFEEDIDKESKEQLIQNKFKILKKLFEGHLNAANYQLLCNNVLASSE